MDTPPPPDDEIDWEDINTDLSTVTYAEFVAFFFDRPVLENSAAYDMFHKLGDYFDVSHPATVVAHLQAMCTNFAEITRTYSPEQIEQGLWAVWGSTIDCARYLFDPAVDPQARVACVDSMYIPFRDVFSRHTGVIRDRYYWMWWDMILHTRALLYKRPEGYRIGYVKVTPDEEQLIDAIFRTCSRILDIDHRGCQWSAIHGMGHLYHPEMQVRTQRYLDDHRDQLTEEDVMWIQAARQNQIM